MIRRPTLLGVLLALAIFLLSACQPTAAPPKVVPRPDLATLFPTAPPIVVEFVTRLPPATPTTEPTATPLTELPTTVKPTPTPRPTLPPTSTPTTPPCTAVGRIEYGTFTSRIQGPTRNYRIYLPPCFGQDGRTYPALYILHGNIRADNEWDEVGIDDSAEILIQAQQLPPMLIIMPDGRTLSDISSGGAGSYEDVIVNELIPHINSTYCAEKSADYRAIGGLSRGGYWSFEIAFRHPDLFESAASHSGSFLDTGQNPNINPLYTATRNDLSGLRIAMDYGGEDWSRNTGIPLHQSMQQADIPHQWVVYPTGGHNDAYWQQHLDSYLRWYAQNWQRDRTAYPFCQPLALTKNR